MARATAEFEKTASERGEANSAALSAVEAELNGLIRTTKEQNAREIAELVVEHLCDQVVDEAENGAEASKMAYHKALLLKEAHEEAIDSLTKTQATSVEKIKAKFVAITRELAHKHERAEVTGNLERLLAEVVHRGGPYVAGATVEVERLFDPAEKEELMQRIENLEHVLASGMARSVPASQAW